MQLIRERWERELAKAEEHKRAGGALIPDQALLLQRMYIDIFSRCDGGALASAGELATGLGPDVHPLRPVWLNPIRLNPT